MRLWMALLLAGTGLLDGAGKAMAQSSTLTRSVLIVAYSPRPPASGYTSFLRSVLVELDRGNRVTLYVQYMSEDQFFPAVGTRCTVRYSGRPLHGIVGGSSGHDADLHAPTIEAFLCKGHRADPVRPARNGNK